MDQSAILIIGSSGQLGTALKAKYPDAKALDSKDLDLTSEEQIMAFDFSPYSLVINAAAYTNVDGAESGQGRILAWQVNARAVALLAKAISNHDSIFVHISTEYVFDGTKTNHKEDEPFSPLGVYAQSKAAGDLVVSVIPKYYLLRTSWVIGEGKNFVRTMLDLGQKGINPKVISDVFGRPTFTPELTRAIDYLVANKVAFGVYNVSNSGDPISWADLARAVFETAGLDITVTDTTDKEYYSDKPQASPRPLNSVFDLSKLQSTGFKSKDWREDLDEFIKRSNQK